ncbi:LemA family protein [Asticcacaulis sp. EMRT-3]|uniref:LemA family protein n=1 Tax=Asticcacaulis sp. EMRT-3 TaxID=3040349 RepID=UPI0024AF1561|nr:LemA family protein [Asticcacaulis sp. EMRT-3]MDI7775190.1 LemA family protein [Asticcacaulis sp. EMRT-3]
MKFTRIIGFIAALSLVTGLAGCGVNAIPTKEENAKAKWSQVENEYKRRADLVPQLVATVKGAAANERGILTDVINARASATKVSVDASTLTDPQQFQKFQQAQDGLSSALGRLMVIQERYPDLKSNEGFVTLQSQLEGNENRIAIARKDYNDAAQDFNTTLRTFPSIIWAKTVYSGSKPMQYFTAPAADANAPTVDFSTAGTATASQ